MSSVIAHILVIAEVGSEHELAKEIMKMQGITEVGITYGEFDLVIKAVAENIAELDKIVTEIRRNPNIIRTSTLFWST